MAAVDSLLRFIAARNADALTIIADAVPELQTGGRPTPLSMPPLAAMLVTGFLNEIGGEGTSRYVSEDGEAFAVTLEGHDKTLRMTFAPAQKPCLKSVPIAPVPIEVVSHTGELESMLDEIVERQASDLVLSADQDAWFRIDGRMHRMPNSALSSEQILEALGRRDEELDPSGSLDFALVRGRRYRVNLFRQARGIAAALRPIRQTVPTLQELNLPSVLHELVGLRNGLVLVAGSAGSGKSTTLAALIEHLNQTQARHIITLEDPIEYEYQSQRCLIHQREIGAQVDDFASGLRAALRESPDIILVGEMRDQATIAAAITAAETGHLVLGTIHASSATVAIDRMLDVFPGEQQRQVRSQLATIVRATLTQVLVESPVSPGRMPAIEVMRSTDAVAAHIREGKTHQLPSAIQTGKSAGMIALEASLADLVKSRRVDYQVALAVAKERSFFQRLVGVAR